ncbi:hypothetical protein HNR42_002031 [Deinobacterium chartae]|uniref:Uncharacterized protein n=1 Tax=Deinobacterium chartae TaxID=521158 RepID=A0A841HYX8_9DEIO|nr:hypothetical protein [Deinobacterium chartae]
MKRILKLQTVLASRDMRALDIVAHSCSSCHFWSCY